MLLSIVEENYIKAIYKIREFSVETVSTNALADHMEIKAATATDMLKKLAEKNLIHYIKYQGVTLTDEGIRKALDIIRKHRLWEMFLVQKLRFNWDEVHEVAEQLEHIRSDKLIDELDHFLGYPTVDPHGDPIPSAKGDMVTEERAALSEFNVGTQLKVIGVKDHTPNYLNLLSSLGIDLSATITIHAINEYDKSISISINDNAKTFISNRVAENLLVSNI